MNRSVALALAKFDDLSVVAQTLEADGFSRAWATELRGRDAFTRAIHMAHHTSEIGVATGIAYAFTRHPLAMAAAAVEGIVTTQGRLTIGIGTGSAHVRSEFGIDFDHPATRLSEYVQLMKAAFAASGDLEHHGAFYDVVMPGFRFASSYETLQAIRIYGAGLNPYALTVLSRFCDGIALHPLGHWGPYLSEVVLPAINKGVKDHERPVNIASWVITCAMEDEETARSLAKAQLALYCAQPGFAPYLERTPWSKISTVLQAQLDATGGRSDWLSIGNQHIPDDMLDQLAAAGTPEQVRDRVKHIESTLKENGVDEIVFQIPGVALRPDLIVIVANELSRTLGPRGESHL